MQSRHASPKVGTKAARGDQPPTGEGCPSSPGTGGVRRSGRVRSSAHKEGPFVRFDDTLPLDQCLRALSSDDDADADWPTLSPDFQATIPALRPRPAQPSRSEAKFLQAVQVYPPTQGTPAALLPNVSTDISPCCPQDFHAVYMATIPRDRAQLLADTVQALDAKLGPNLVKVLGLSLLGSKHAATWKLHEELLFCLGMCDKYRMFKSMKRLFLRHRSVHELNGYYHNVWKTRSTAEADEFLALREQGAAEHVIRQFEENIRQRLAAMWDSAQFGEQPVSSCGPALYKQRLGKPGHAVLWLPAAGPAVLPAATRPVLKSSPKSARASPSAGGAWAPAAGRSSPQLTAPLYAAGAGATALNGRTITTSAPSAAAAAAAGAYNAVQVVDLSDPAVLAAMPAVQNTPIAPRPGARVLSGGRLKLGAGVTHLGTAAQQQQQPLMSPNGAARYMLPPAAARAAPGTAAMAAAADGHSAMQQSLSPDYQRNAVIWGSKLTKAAGAAAATDEAVTVEHSSRPQQQRAQEAEAEAAAAAAAAAAAGEGHSAQPGDVTVLATGDIHAPSFLSLPEMARMPHVPVPDGSDPQQFQVWLKALGACRAAMTDYKQQVALRADFVVHDAQQRMQQAQQQQHHALLCAETYLHELQDRREVVVSKLQAEAHQQHQHDRHVQSSQQQQQQEQQQQQQEQQQGPQPSQQLQHSDDLLSDESLPPQNHQQQHQTAIKVESLQSPAAAAPTQALPQRPVPLDQLQSAVQLLLQRPGGRKHDRQGNSSSSRARRSTASWGQTSASQQQQGESYSGHALAQLAGAAGPQAKRQKVQPAVAGIATAAVS